MGVGLSAAVTTSSREGWAELIERTAAGDRESFARLFDGTSPYVNSLARRILGDREAAEEVVLEVYVRSLHSVHGCTFLAWKRSLPSRSRADAAAFC